MEDGRVTAARELLSAEEAASNWSPLHNALDGLLTYADERLKINVGLVSENASLRAKMRQPEVIDLTEISTRDLLDEVAHRLEDSQ